MNLARIILGLLAIAPMTGYDIKRHLDSTVQHFWSADKAQVYRALSSIVDDDLATVEVVAGDGAPDRLVHHITDAGRAALSAWLVDDLPRQPERDAFLARLFFSDTLDDDQLAALLDARRERAGELLATLEAMREAQPEPSSRGARMRLATLDNGIAHARAELEWISGVAA